LDRAIPSETEVLIVGGGPAGLAAAIALRQRGIECIVVEALSPAIDKACGEGLAPDSRESLARLGVRLDETDGHCFRGIRFENVHHRVDAEFASGLGIGVRRPRLHTRLAARAEEAGVHLLWNSRVQLPARESRSRSDGHAVTIDGRRVRCRWLVGADGQASSIRRWAGLDRARKQSLRFGIRAHYRVAPWSDYVEVHWGRHGQLYVTPVAGDCVCVAYVARDPRPDRAGFLGEFPGIARRLQGAGIVSRQRGGASATRKLYRVAYDSVALIGDASGSSDCITGEGLAVSFRQAMALAESIHSGSLAPYRRAHRRIGRLPHAMGALMLTLDRWPGLQSRAIPALASNPILFRELLSAHTGDRSLASVLLRRAPRFGWSLLAGGVQA
jgi:menaquinone-9 beta-reductase